MREGNLYDFCIPFIRCPWSLLGQQGSQGACHLGRNCVPHLGLREGPRGCFPATARADPPDRRPHPVSPFSKAETLGMRHRGVRRFLGTRLTCSTVGVCVPGFLVKHQGALGSDHPHERRDFAGRRETLDIFSTAPLLLGWLPSDCFKGHSSITLTWRQQNDCV